MRSEGPLAPCLLRGVSLRVNMGWIHGQVSRLSLSWEWRVKNEAAVIKHIQSNTNIPVPTVRCCFEDNGRLYIITDLVPGVPMSKLSLEEKTVVMKEIELHLQTMQGLKSSVMGGPLGDVCLPFRHPNGKPPTFKQAETPEFVFCHNDLSQHYPGWWEYPRDYSNHRLGVCWILPKGIRRCLLQTTWPIRCIGWGGWRCPLSIGRAWKVDTEMTRCCLKQFVTMHMPLYALHPTCECYSSSESATSQ